MMLRALRSRASASAMSKLVSFPQACASLEAACFVEDGRSGLALGFEDSYISSSPISVSHARPLVSLAAFRPFGGAFAEQQLPQQVWGKPQTDRPATGAGVSGSWGPVSTADVIHLPPCSARRYAAGEGPNACKDTASTKRHRTESDHGSTEQPIRSHSGDAMKHDAAPGSVSGWTKQEVWNAPNMISLARLASGPLIAHWIVSGQMQAALAGLIISGWSDWLDGYVARRFNQQSVIGSYLDPLADKALICCVVAALGIQGTLPAYLVTVIIGRDVFLVGASFAVRARALGWRSVSAAEFFSVNSNDSKAGSGHVVGNHERQQIGFDMAAERVTPLYVSKVNTVFQLATVSGFLLRAVGGWPPMVWLDLAAMITASTTLLSGIAYVSMSRTNSRTK